MEYFAFARTAPKPCSVCNREELRILQREYEKGTEAFWIYRIPVYNGCRRCANGKRSYWDKYATRWFVPQCCAPLEMIDIPIKLDTVGVVERAIHGAAIGEKGSNFRAHGTFVKHLSGLAASEEYRQALCSWAPTAMMAFMDARSGVSRKLRRPTHKPPPGLEKQDSPTAAKISAALKEDDERPLPPQLAYHPPGNDDILDGNMVATHLNGDEYGEEDRIEGEVVEQEPKDLAKQIGPDLIPTEAFGSTKNNLKAGAAKRVKPLPFRADKKMIRKIDKFVSVLIAKVFNRDAINKFREEYPDFDDFKSSKWSSARWTQAWDEALAENAEINQTFQIKVNEALPAKGKAPRPIIQCGDKAQVLMKYPVKCFEHLLFEYFEDASIKHLPKHEAMRRVAEHLRMQGGNVVEGDGSAWDACCNARIRGMTENRIIRHIISCLGEDPQVPATWMQVMLDDMEKREIKGKAKVDGWQSTPLKVAIEAIRQSGHTGTSCFNWLINFVCWVCVLAEDPWNLIGKSRKTQVLHSRYISAFTGKGAFLKYSFEGDDSALSSTECLKDHQQEIEKLWTSLGFRMKLVFVDQKMTFTGFDFLCDQDGPTGDFVPEIPRNIASSSWSCSSELKMHPEKLHQVGAAAMLARAENFRDCGPYMHYFAALGMAHMRRIQDFSLGESEALSLGIQVSPSVKEALQDCLDSAERMNPRMQQLVDLVAPFETEEQQLAMLACDFGSNPFDLQLARELVPFTVWDPANFSLPRRA